MNPIQSVGIIGAGIAGLTCAQTLHRAGLDVTVVEKSRGVGGRVATRRTDSGVTFDHGAQYFTVRDPRFAAQVECWRESGAVRLWPGRIVSVSRGEVTPLHEARERFVGVPAMNAMAKELASGLKVQTNFTAKPLRRSGDGWELAAASNTTLGPFDLVISTAPPPQSSLLLAGLSDPLERALAAVTMDPCWGVMLEGDGAIATPYDAAFVHDSPLRWIARNSSKPGRDEADAWVLHASAAWSRTHLEESAESIVETLVAAFWEATGRVPQPLRTVVAHRWRYALPDSPLAERFVLDGDVRVGACGDWCGGPRLEGAYLSGLAMAEAILASR